MVILGIDPGSSRIGWGAVRKDGDWVFAGCGTIEIKSADLRKTESELNALLNKFRPALVAVEKLYFVKNQKSALAVSQARGVIMLTVAKRNIPILEYAPTEVKSAIAGDGRASKKTVAAMAARILKIGKIGGLDDASDALAIALTAAARHRLDTLKQ